MPILEGRKLEVRTRRGDSLLGPLDLAIEAGEIVFLLGPSGAGKTLTLLSLAGLLPQGLVFSGKVFFKGKELTALSSKARRRVLGKEIGLVLQEPGLALDPVVPVGKQVGEALRFHYGLSRREALVSAEAALAQEGLRPAAELARRCSHTLSGGMRQRVLLAQVFSLAPDLLLLDEPAGALDLLRQADLAWRVSREVRERGISVLWVSHDLRLARTLAGKVAFLARGRILETGPARLVLDDPFHPFSRWFLGKGGRFGGGGQGEAEGCPWKGDCPRADERCRRFPPLTRTSRGREVLCWNPGKV